MKSKNDTLVLTETIFQLHDDSKIPLLQFQMFCDLPWIAHCFTTKAGGVSQGIYESLNLSFTRGDNKDAVIENYRRVAEAMKTTTEHIVTSDQTHTANIRLVTKKDAGKGVTVPRDYTDIDGLITNEPGLLLATFYADCVPLYFIDSKHRAIGLSHSGWRGTVARMGEVTIREMRRAFDTDPKDLLCAIGPSICRECYEVSEDVACEFTRAFPTHEEEILLSKGNGKYQLDLWNANRQVLLDAGVQAEHIALTNICTCCNSDRLFSHRATKGRRGNLGAFLMIRPDEEEQK